MNCEDVRLLLDAYMDGEISDEDEQALMDHAKACKSCAEELKAAELLRDALAHIDDDLTIPIQAQAAWRSAVREEVKKNQKTNMKRWLRCAYAVAAALVLVLGVNLLHDGKDAQIQQMMPAAGIEEASAAIVARDGGRRMAVQVSGQDSDCTVRKKIAVASLEEAARLLEMLAAEYSGVCSADGEAACRVELPRDYLHDFLKASASIGTELDSETVEAAGASVTILFQFVQE